MRASRFQTPADVPIPRVTTQTILNYNYQYIKHAIKSARTTKKFPGLFLIRPQEVRLWCSNFKFGGNLGSVVVIAIDNSKRGHYYDPTPILRFWVNALYLSNVSFWTLISWILLLQLLNNFILKTKQLVYVLLSIMRQNK